MIDEAERHAEMRGLNRKAWWVGGGDGRQDGEQDIPVARDLSQACGQLADGGCRELATAYHKLGRDLPRDND